MAMPTVDVVAFLPIHAVAVHVAAVLCLLFFSEMREEEEEEASYFNSTWCFKPKFSCQKDT